MNENEILEKVREIAPPNHVRFSEVRVMPDAGCHFFVIGTQHFGEMYIDPHKAPCDFCKKPYHDKVHNTSSALFVELYQDITEKELIEDLGRVKDVVTSDLKIDGFAFLNAEKFKVMRGEEDLFSKSKA